MFFILSKTVGFIAVPSNVLVLIGLAGIALLPTRFAPAGRRLLVASVILIAAIGTLPIGDALFCRLRNAFHLGIPCKGRPLESLLSVERFVRRDLKRGVSFPSMRKPSG